MPKLDRKQFFQLLFLALSVVLILFRSAGKGSGSSTDWAFATAMLCLVLATESGQHFRRPTDLDERFVTIETKAHALAFRLLRLGLVVGLFFSDKDGANYEVVVVLFLVSMALPTAVSLWMERVG